MLTALNINQNVAPGAVARACGLTFVDTIARRTWLKIEEKVARYGKQILNAVQRFLYKTRLL